MSVKKERKVCLQFISSSSILDAAFANYPLMVDFPFLIDAPTRLSIFQLPSASNPPYSTLLPLAFQQNTLSDSLVLIVLDWERPWTFLDDLRGWLGALTRLVQNIESRKAGQAKGEQGGQSGEYIVQEALESRRSLISQSSFSLNVCAG